jgi:quinol monooxygenase YgiN
MLHVVASFDLVAGQRPEFLELFHALAPQVRAEAGCLEYGPAVDAAVSLAGVPAPRADAVTILEKWTGEAALAAHLAAPHMQAFFARTRPLVKTLVVNVLQPA